MMRRTLPALLTLLSLSPMAFATEKTMCSAPPATLALVQEQQALNAALRLSNERAFEQAGPALDNVISGSYFGSLALAEQHKAYAAAAYVALQLNNIPKADTLLSRAINMDETTELDWKFRLATSEALGNTANGTAALTRLAQSWPKSLHDIPDPEIYKMIRLARKNQADSNNEEHLLDALANAQWTLKDGTPPNSAWKELALLHMASGDKQGAATAAALITSPGMLVSLRADSRFADAVAANPQHYDIDKAATQDIDALRTDSEAHPRSLVIIEKLGNALLVSGRYQEALALTDGTLKKIADAPKGTFAFDDISTKLNWIDDIRSRALAGLNRWPEAATQELEASQLPEYGHANISQTVNLASMYSEMGKPEAALQALAGVNDSSPYVAMQKQAIRHAAALQLGDRKTAADSLAYLQQHQADAIRTYEAELIRSNDLDAAAALMISRLGDSAQRNDALTDLQDYLPPPTSSQTPAFMERWAALKARADVQAAVAKVGTIGKYNIAKGSD